MENLFLYDKMPKVLVNMVEEYTHGYKQCYNNVIQELKDNFKRKKLFMKTDKEYHTHFQNPLISEHTLWQLKCDGIEGTQARRARCIERHNEEIERQTEWMKNDLERYDRDIRTLIDIQKREEAGEEIINKEFWNNYDRLRKIMDDNSKFIRLNTLNSKQKKKLKKLGRYYK